MYCLIQFYIQLKGDLSEHRPLLKIAAIKLVIFLSFWQTVNSPLPLSCLFYQRLTISTTAPNFILYIYRAYQA